MNAINQSIQYLKYKRKRKCAMWWRIGFFFLKIVHTLRQKLNARYGEGITANAERGYGQYV